MKPASDIGLYFDSWDETFKKPFGAIERNSKVDFKISFEPTISSKINRIDMELFYEDKKMFIEMNHDSEFYYISWKFEHIGLYFYRFVIYIDHHRYFLAPEYLATGGLALLYEDEKAPSYQLTVHGKIEKVPEFYSEGTVYQIFVDRFANGNENGQLLDIKPNSYIYSSWEDTPSYIKGPNGEILRWDFYGGNLKGVIDKLDYLKQLGVTCIYLNPIFLARSCHKYDTADYSKIDSMFGDEEIFKELIEKAKNKNMYIILDGVFSHTGSDSIYFNKYGNYSSIGAYQSKESKYFSWFKFKNHPESYDSWWGIGDLPNVNEMEPSYLEFITGEEGIVAKWMKMGIKGFRLDVADELPEEFIKILRKRMKSIDKDSVLLGEVWEDATNKISYGERRQYMLGESLDSVTAYPYRRTLFNFINREISAQTFYNICTMFKENYPKEYYKSSLKMIGSHDVQRAMTELGSERKFLLAVTMQLLFLGPVLIYYGDEVGLTGGKDPENRATYPWDSYEHLGFKYESKTNPRKNLNVFNHYKKILEIRTNEPVIKKGNVSYLVLSKRSIAYRRFDDKNEIYVIANSSELSEEVIIETNSKKYVDLLTGEELFVTGDRLELIIEGESSRIIKRI